MKNLIKKALPLTLASLILLPATSMAYPIHIQGKKVSDDAIILKDTVYVPLSKTVEKLGGWIELEKSEGYSMPVICRGDYEIEYFVKNGKVVKGITYVPLKTIQEAFGQFETIKWDSKKRTIYITHKKQTNIKTYSASEAEQLVRNAYKVPKEVIVEFDGMNKGQYLIHVYEIVIDKEIGEGHTATWGWYYVNPQGGKITSMF